MFSFLFLCSGDARVGGGWEGSEEPSTGWQESCHPGETCWTLIQKYTPCSSSPLADVNVDAFACVHAAFPGEGGGAGAGGGQRAAAAGGDPHGTGGGPAQRPPPPGSGELPDRAAAGPTQGTMYNSSAARCLTAKQSFYQHFLYIFFLANLILSCHFQPCCCRLRLPAIHWYISCSCLYLKCDMSKTVRVGRRTEPKLSL